MQLTEQEQNVFYTFLNCHSDHPTSSCSNIVFIYVLNETASKTKLIFNHKIYSRWFSNNSPELILIYCGFRGRCRLQYGAHSSCTPQFKSSHNASRLLLNPSTEFCSEDLKCITINTHVKKIRKSN